MAFQWLQMRITEEQERRRREAQIREMLPAASKELQGSLSECVGAYTAAFGAASATMDFQPPVLRIVAQEPPSKLEVIADPAIPGFDVRRDGENALTIEVGLLPSNRLSYRDRAADQYLNNEELTRRILDRTLFPNLKD